MCDTVFTVILLREALGINKSGEWADFLLNTYCLKNPFSYMAFKCSLSKKKIATMKEEKGKRTPPPQFVSTHV